ncbi:MAG: fasciclin domain-containing protein [Scytonema sp. PMC 1069.18]|nr:fasciclin domain-containing protein [Scytonema sp. PMC 1069.18]MEC4887277.1 fasciclin domain-containing protein [Scytonema sp. PMC 1070.18]
MKTGTLTQFTKKLAVITGLIGTSALMGVPAIAQMNNSENTQQPGVSPTPSAQPIVPGVATPDNNTPMDNTPSNATPSTGASSRSVVEVASSSNSFNTLTQAVKAAGLADTLSNGTYTVFAPTDEAFNNSLPKGAVEFLLQPENRNLLRQVLTYHVLQGEVTANELRTGSVDTLGGGLAVRVTPERVIVNNASVVNANIQASNGVIHAVNRVLLPEQLRQTIASRLETYQTSQN